MFVDANSYTDGSGNAANDTTGLQNAINYASQNRKRLIVTRDFHISSQLNVPVNTHIEGETRATQIIPQGSLTSAFNVTSGNTTIRQLSFPGNGSAQSFITVQKGWDNSPVRLSELVITTTRNGINWIDGDVPMIGDIYGINNLYLVNFANNGMNGSVSKLFNLGGQLLQIQSASQQMEGTNFSDLHAIQGTGTFGGAANLANPIINIQSGLALRFSQVLVDQVTNGGGLVMQGLPGKAVSDVTVQGIWIGASSSIVQGTHGIWLVGNVTGAHVTGGYVTGITDWNIRFNAGADGTLPSHSSFEKLQVLNGEYGAILSEGAYNIAVSECRVEGGSSTASIYENPNSGRPSTLIVTRNAIVGAVTASTTSIYRDNIGPSAFNNR